MSKSVLSIIMKCWYDPQTNTTRLQLVRTDTAETVYLDNGSFLLRITEDDVARTERCFIRHIASGREVYVQSGPGLQAFIQSYLLSSGNTSQT
ncbi:MAG TPA: hypothetical protein VKR42_07475 [Ktedonobacteraceae bacterium]|nr:hypothetical protein [Ktedonobacteraceae bacterium]